MMSLIAVSTRYSSSLKTLRRGVNPPLLLNVMGQPFAMTMGGERLESSGDILSSVAASPRVVLDAQAGLVAISLVPSDSGIVRPPCWILSNYNHFGNSRWNA